MRQYIFIVETDDGEVPALETAYDLSKAYENVIKIPGFIRVIDCEETL